MMPRDIVPITEKIQCENKQLMYQSHFTRLYGMSRAHAGMYLTVNCAGFIRGKEKVTMRIGYAWQVNTITTRVSWLLADACRDLRRTTTSGIAAIGRSGHALTHEDRILSTRDRAKAEQVRAINIPLRNESTQPLLEQCRLAGSA
jgi:hypothetical protein